MYFDRVQNRFRSSQTLFETNYVLLDHFLPDLTEVKTLSTTDSSNSMLLSVQLREHSPYFALVELMLAPLTNIDVVSTSQFIVRIYHDAKVAEVVEFQGKKKFLAWYPQYPNNDMYVKDEKRQINSLLSEMLKFCKASGISFERIHSR